VFTFHYTYICREVSKPRNDHSKINNGLHKPVVVAAGEVADTTVGNVVAIPGVVGVTVTVTPGVVGGSVGQVAVNHDTHTIT